MPTKHLFIKGRVQGVFFRASAKEAAETLGVTGWVKNTVDGDVEVLATGTEDQLAAFSDWCRQGPPRSIVSSIVIEEVEEKAFMDFKILRG